LLQRKPTFFLDAYARTKHPFKERVFFYIIPAHTKLALEGLMEVTGY
jgi:hypothetical protein